jgi:hypothetical protein
MSDIYVEVFFPPGTNINTIYDYCRHRNYWPELTCLIKDGANGNKYLTVINDTSGSDTMS